MTPLVPDQAQPRLRAVAGAAAVLAADVVLVLGSQNSSNSKRLVETAREQGKASYLIDDASELDAAWLAGLQQFLPPAAVTVEAKSLPVAFEYVGQTASGHLIGQQKVARANSTIGPRPQPGAPHGYRGAATARVRIAAGPHDVGLGAAGQRLLPGSRAGFGA